MIQNHVTPSHSMDDDSDQISELNDDDLLNKFLSYLRENFDDEEKKLMIQQLLNDGGYQLDGDGDLCSRLLLKTLILENGNHSTTTVPWIIPRKTV